MDRKEITAVLASAGLRPQHKFGQNFMVDQRVLGAIADAGHVGLMDVVLEVGPGVGNLTRLLAMRTGSGAVLAVDIDAKLMAAAREHLKEQENIHWMRADVLAGKHEINPEVVEALRGLQTKHQGGELKLVSNLPYNAASPLVAELLVLMWQEKKAAGGGNSGLFFKSLTFTVQLEVAQRMKAAVGTSDYGPLGILIQLLADVELLQKIPPGCFWPPPKVHSALVRVTPRAERFGAVSDVLGLQKLLSGLFSHRRQRVSNGLKHYLGERFSAELLDRLTARGIDVTRRPEELGLQQFVEMLEGVEKLGLTQ